MSEFEFTSIEREADTAKSLTATAIECHWTVDDMEYFNDEEVPVEVSGDAIATMTRKASRPQAVNLLGI